MSTVSGTNDFDLVMSYSLWIQNGSTEEKETFLNCPFTKKRPLSIPEHVILASGVHNRYWVLDVQDVTSSQSCTEKHLTITCSKTTQSREACILKDGWESTPVAVGDVVHLEGRCVSGLWTIDRDSGFLVLLPDLLISGTSIASSIRCMRRGVLGEMFKAFDGGSKQMLNGTIVHDIFQKAAMSSDFSPERIQTFAAEALRSPNYLGQMYSLKLTQADMRQEVEEYLPSLSEWAKHYVHTSPQAGQKQLTLKLPSDGALSKQDATCSMTVTDFVDIEENIWCPRFGLKGKIDVTAGVRIHRRGRRPTERIVPLELKTGKESNSIEHRSQVILYTLMSSARRCDPEAGFLVYLKTGSLHPVVGNHMDRRELVKIRNSLAHHIGNSLVKVDGRSQMAPLPAIESDKQACKYCPQKRNCAVYNRAVERDPHLSHVHLQYFSDWLLLCTLEALTMENKGGRRNIWLQTAQQREKSGGCVGNMQLDRDVSVLSDGVYKHSFVRKEGNQTLTGLIVGDRIVVSDQDSVLIGLATGYVTEITISGLTCSLDKNLSKFSSNTVFRLDQDEGAGGLSNHLGNLSMLMENTPTRSDHPFFFFLFFVLLYLQFFSIKQAMKKVLLSKDYTLIVGMPGTGKTTTICTLVPAPETVEKSGISNHTEAILVQALVTLLLKAGCRASDIGVIAPYRQQLKAISSLLQGDAFKALEVNTVDKYQGRDKSIIIVSFVRSNPEDNLGELLQDWRRLNVAITRAKHKLLMLGSAPTLRRYAPLEKLLCHLQQEDMISFTSVYE
uniref:DNA replication ATP-dependent helicase/nuclease DNA2 n=1 Tax=Sinocyclocheilus anshuiensis TaxID=1608454 RepID=A0A671L0V3_9TELE